MRIHLKTNSINEKVPFNYQPKLTGTLHKWLGNNTVHDSLSLYSFSWLKGGTADREGLSFRNGANWFISAHSAEAMKNLITGIKQSPSIAYDLTVTEIVIEEDPLITSRVKQFECASPVLIKRTVDKKTIHYTYDQLESDNFMTETLTNKLKLAGLDFNGVKVSFNRQYKGAKTKVIHYNNIGNKSNICPVIVEGTPEQLSFAWNVGVGNSTGIGFGALN